MGKLIKYSLTYFYEISLISYFVLVLIENLGIITVLSIKLRVGANGTESKKTSKGSFKKSKNGKFFGCCKYAKIEFISKEEKFNF
jgi:hypothetical protein